MLDQLPEFILLEILNYLEIQHRFRLLTINKSFSQICLTSLVNTIKRWDETTEKFWKTNKKNKSMARYVKVVELGMEVDEAGIQLLEEGLFQNIQSIKRVGGVAGSLYLKRVLKGTPRLERLEVRMNRWCFNDEITLERLWFLRCLKVEDAYFNELEHLKGPIETLGYRNALEMLLDSLDPNRIEQLELNRLGMALTTVSLLKITKEFQNLTSLSLFTFTWPTNLYQFFLTKFPNLIKLKLTLIDNLEIYPNAQPRQLILRPEHYPKLRDLGVFIKKNTSIRPTFLKEYTWPQLRCLNIDTWFEILPSQVIYLTKLTLTPIYSIREPPPNLSYLLNNLPNLIELICHYGFPICSFLPPTGSLKLRHLEVALSENPFNPTLLNCLAYRMPSLTKLKLITRPSIEAVTDLIESRDDWKFLSLRMLSVPETPEFALFIANRSPNLWTWMTNDF